MLYYYKSPENSEPVGSISLDSITQVTRKITSFPTLVKEPSNPHLNLSQSSPSFGGGSGGGLGIPPSNLLSSSPPNSGSPPSAGGIGIGTGMGGGQSTSGAGAGGTGPGATGSSPGSTNAFPSSLSSPPTATSSSSFPSSSSSFSASSPFSSLRDKVNSKRHLNFAFEVKTLDRTFHMYADTHQEMEDWIQVLVPSVFSLPTTTTITHQHFTLVLTVQNVDCERCSERVRTLISKLPGVNAVIIDMEGDTVTVTGRLDIDELLTKLEDAGFPACIV